MARNRFVEPETLRIDIGDGDWIVVKKRLSIGEARRAQASLIKEVRADGRITPNMETIGKAEVIAYLVDWSFGDKQGRSVRIDDDLKKAAAIDNLTQEDFAIVSEAVSKHVAAMEVERESEKNARDGGSDTSRISPSAV